MQLCDFDFLEIDCIRSLQKCRLYPKSTMKPNTLVLCLTKIKKYTSFGRHNHYKKFTLDLNLGQSLNSLIQHTKLINLSRVDFWWCLPKKTKVLVTCKKVTFCGRLVKSANRRLNEVYSKKVNDTSNVKTDLWYVDFTVSLPVWFLVFFFCFQT